MRDDDPAGAHRIPRSGWSERPAAPAPSPEELFPNVVVEQVFAPSSDGPVRCEVFRPEGAPSNLPTMLYFHGGGFMVGRSEDTEFLTRKMCL